jgi:methionyl-tRNA formyltransferase
VRIIFFGTPDIAVPTLERLIASRFDVVGVVSQPDRRRGRGRKVSPSPVAQVALDREIPLLRPERVGDAEVEAELRALAPDVGVVVAFGQFIPKKIRELPSCGYLINAHASLLPKYRGAAPIAFAILAGETHTGISVMRVDREMDTGPVALMRKLEIQPGENTGELSERLSLLAADAILEAVIQIDEDRLGWSEQDHSQASFATKLGRDDAELDWNRSARELACRIHALAPKPGAFSLLDGDPLRILAAHCEDVPCDLEPGTIERPGPSQMRIATGAGWLVPVRIQRAGGKALDVEAFLRGMSIEAGTRLTSRQEKPDGE